MASEKGRLSLDAVVVGGGIGGLSAAIRLAQKGHKVRVLEGSKSLNEFGAGIQVTPNATRVLSVFGVLPALEKVAHRPTFSFIRRYSTGEVLLQMHPNPDSKDSTYGFPHFQFHRPDLQRVLAEHMSGLGVMISFGSRVARLDCEEGRLWMEDGSCITGDLIVCADGIRSATRGFFPGNEAVAPKAFDEFAYRAVVSAHAMGLDPDTAELHASGNTQIWCAPGRGVVAYPVARGALFNIAVSVPKGSGGFAGKWTDAGDVAEFRSLFSDFNPLVQKIASRVERCAQWTLAEIPDLATWTSGKAVLLGDAAHAMSPMAAQGAAMAIEDAAVLGECLDSLSELAAVPNLLKRYQAIRRPRAERVVELARHNAIALTLPDGQEQQARDERWQEASRVFENTVAMREKIEPAARSRPKPDMNQKWGQPGLMMWLYGFDAIEDAKARQD